MARDFIAHYLSLKFAGWAWRESGRPLLLGSRLDSATTPLLPHPIQVMSFCATYVYC